MAVHSSGRRREKCAGDVKALYYFFDPYDAKPDDTPGVDMMMTCNCCEHKTERTLHSPRIRDNLLV